MTVTAQLGGQWNIVHAIITASATAGVWSWAANAVDTFPVPENKYWRWLLGCVQQAIGQKARASNTFNNLDTLAVPQPKKNGNGVHT
jgi:hypothetical protein